MGMFMVPLSTLSLSTLHKDDIAAGAGLFSFGRNLGSSIGISMLSTIIARETQINWNRLGGNINPFNNNLQLWLNHQGWQLHDPAALSILQNTLAAQSRMIAYVDSFWIIGLSLILLIPFIFFIKKPDRQRGAGMMH